MRVESRQRGAAAIELALIMAFVLVPVMSLMLVVPTWIERQTAGRDAAAQTARAVILGSGDLDSAVQLVPVVEQGYQLPAGTLSYSHLEGQISPGADFTVVVQVRQPALTLPGLGTLGGWTWDARHTEHYPQYGQLLP